MTLWRRSFSGGDDVASYIQWAIVPRMCDATPSSTTFQIDGKPIEGRELQDLNRGRCTVSDGVRWCQMVSDGIRWCQMSGPQQGGAHLSLVGDGDASLRSHSH